MVHILLAWRTDAHALQLVNSLTTFVALSLGCHFSLDVKIILSDLFFFFFLFCFLSSSSLFILFLLSFFLSFFLSPLIFYISSSWRIYKRKAVWWRAQRAKEL